MEQAMTIKMLENINMKNKIIIHKEIICAVDIQCEAIKLVSTLFTILLYIKLIIFYFFKVF